MEPSSVDGNTIGSLDIEYLFFQLYRVFSGEGTGEVITLARDLWFGINVVAAVAVPVLFFVYMRIKAKGEAVMEAETERYKTLSAQAAGTVAGNPRWQEIVDLVNSDSPGNWRLAIIEADVMLDDLVRRLGYIGDTLGERLKGVDVSTFRSLNEAWEAHRVRNQIAHEGSDFVLTQREARRVVGLFQRVFQEHGLI